MLRNLKSQAGTRKGERERGAIVPLPSCRSDEEVGDTTQTALRPQLQGTQRSHNRLLLGQPGECPDRNTDAFSQEGHFLGKSQSVLAEVPNEPGGNETVDKGKE